MKSKADSLLFDFVPTLLCAVVVTIGMAWWIWSLRPYPDVFVGLMFVQLVPWLGAFICCIVIRRIRPGWPLFIRAFLTSACGMILFFLLFGGLASLVESGVVELRHARGINIPLGATGDLYYSYQGERGMVGGTAAVGEGLRGLWPNTLISWIIGLISSVVWLPLLSILSVIWIFGWRGGAGFIWQSMKAGHSIQWQESEKIAILLDSIPILFAVLLLLIGECVEWRDFSTYLDFGLIEYIFSLLPWGMGLMSCIAIRKRFPGRPRWLRSFLAVAYAFLFCFVTVGPRQAFAEEATHQWRLICGTHRVERLFDGPWWFHDDGDEGMGKGIAGIQEDTLQSLQGVYIALPVSLVVLLFLCLLNDYLIRLCKFTSKTSSP